MPVQVKYRFRGRRCIFARSSIDFVAGAALSQGEVIDRKIQRYIDLSARSSTDFAAGAALSRGRVQISRQAQHFRKVKCRFRCRRSTFARSSADFVAGAAILQGQVQIDR